MLREKIKKIFNNKALYMVLSIVAAVLLWAYVTSIQNEFQDSTIPGIIVTFSGQEKLLSEHNLIVDPNSNYTVALKLMGKRDIITRLSNSNVTVSVDLSDISSAGTYNKLFVVNLPSNINTKEVYVLDKVPEYVSVRIIQYETRSIALSGNFTGTLKEGCEAKPIEFNPTSISVGGPKDIVSRIAYAWVTLEEPDVNRTLHRTVNYILVDQDGNRIPTSDLKLDRKTVDITLPVIMTKNVPLTVKFNSGGGATKDNVSYSISPSSVRLSGDPEVLEGINEIVLHTINLEETLENKTETYNIPIPSELSNLSGQAQATVHLSLSGLSTKTIQISNLHFTNIHPGYKATPEQPLDVIIRGPENIIKNITEDDIDVTADLGSLGQNLGSHTVDAKVTVKNRTDVAAIGKYTLTVLLEDPAQTVPGTVPGTVPETPPQTPPQTEAPT